MMTPRLLFPVLISCLLNIGGGARAQDLAEMVRELNFAQNRAVIGDEAARGETAKRLDLIEQFLPSLEADDWKQSKNLGAAAIYLLCGGSPRTLRKLFDDHALADDGAPLIAASLAFAEGQKEEAAKLFSSIDAKSFPPSLAAHLALVQGGLTVGADKKRAAALFDLARLLMPGSLVEEASLRRELTILDTSRDTTRYLLLARRYVRQYAKSPFAKNFWNQLTATSLAAATNLDASRLDEFDELFAQAETTARFELRLTIARMSILHAQIDMAADWIAKAEALADTPRARDRLRLYTAALKAERGDLDAGLAELRKLETSALTREELELMKIVSGVVARLQPPPASAARTADGASSTPKPNEISEETPLISELRQSLAESDALLKKAERR
jgi:chemotaxis protein MotC